MPQNLTIRVLLLHHFKGRLERQQLRTIEVIGGFIIVIQAAHKTDTHRSTVVPIRMCSYVLKRLTVFYRPITPNHQMIPNTSPALVLVPLVYLSNTNILIAPGGSTMHDNQVSFLPLTPTRRNRFGLLCWRT